jgi:hypothetical protein
MVTRPGGARTDQTQQAPSSNRGHAHSAAPSQSIPFRIVHPQHESSETGSPQRGHTCFPHTDPWWTCSTSRMSVRGRSVHRHIERDSLVSWRVEVGGAGWRVAGATRARLKIGTRLHVHSVVHHVCHTPGDLSGHKACESPTARDDSKTACGSYDSRSAKHKRFLAVLRQDRQRWSINSDITQCVRHRTSMQALMAMAGILYMWATWPACNVSTTQRRTVEDAVAHHSI